MAEGGKDLVDSVEHGEVIGETDLVHDGDDFHGEPTQPGITPGPKATPAGQVPKNHTGADDPVALQLQSMATAITGLAALFQSTSGDVVEMRAELVSLRATPPAAAAAASIPTPPPVLSQVAPQTFAPTIANLRVDANLAAQAEQLVADLSSNISGMP
jgi:hypothetical protein